EGLNHFIEAARSDFDITLIVSNNRLYSLTTGQASPTSKKGTKTKSTPDGVKKTDLNPLLIALSSGAGFVSRGYANEVDYLSDIFKKAISHKGFSLVDVLQPCITLDKVNTKEWYQKRIYQLDDKWPVKDRNKAIIKVQEYGERIPLGIFFEEK
ncbi:MAG: thiamine pyrophosphate-dependent enzyme, partial [Patescibacteria group bacterium]